MENINEIKKKYYDILDDKDIIEEYIKVLKENPHVKDYIKAMQVLEKTEKQEHELYKKIKIHEYSNCDHLFIFTEKDMSNCMCIKCGIKHDIYPLTLMNKSELSLDEEAMTQYYNISFAFENGTYTSIKCNYDNARKIYEEILKENPSIEDNDEIENIFIKKLNKRKMI